MNALNQWLENNGQNPRTFVRDVILFVIKFYVIIFVVLSPITVLSFVLKPSGSTGDTTPAEIPPYFALLAIPFIIYLFCAITIAIALIGGWHRLSRRFRAPDNFEEGQIFRGQSARVGAGNYNSVLTIRVAPEGLYLACPLLFRLMHPPLLIPWQEITVVKKNKHAFGRVSALLSIGKPRQATLLLINKKLLQAAATYLPELNP